VQRQISILRVSSGTSQEGTGMKERRMKKEAADYTGLQCGKAVKDRTNHAFIGIMPVFPCTLL
jgi:hypothetical protein